MDSAAAIRRSSKAAVIDTGSILSRLNESAEVAVVGDDAAAAPWVPRRRLLPASSTQLRDDDDDEAGHRRRPLSPRGYDVFINHRGVDTKHNVARLLYERLEQLGGGRVRSFLDNMSMRPGDRLVERINEGIRQCRVGVAIFSPHYFDSDFCLHELAELVHARKVIIPIFYGIKPSELVLPPAVLQSGAHAPREIERYRLALHEVKNTVGLTHDPATGDLAELVKAAANAVMDRLQETQSVAPRREMIPSRL